MRGAWRVILIAASLILLVSIPVRANRHEPVLPAPKLNNDGLYTQNWFHDSLLDLRQDLVAAQKEDMRLIIFWEQKDCTYCDAMHKINLRIPRVVEKINESFYAIRLNIWGKRKIIDLDGSVVSESALARRNNIVFTPTVQFLAPTIEKAGTGNASDTEDFRFEGYFKPFHYYFFFHYVLSKGYEIQPSFQRWLGEIGKVLQESNVEYDIWADALPVGLPDHY